MSKNAAILAGGNGDVFNKYGQIIAFIRELYNEPHESIPLHVPVFLGNEKSYLEECIDTTFVSSVGKFVDSLEEKIALYTGSKYAVATVNGTSALQISLILSGVEPGDEVITQPLTFVATANAIAYCGARPVFLDIDKNTLGLSAEKLTHFLKNSTRYSRKDSKLINIHTSRPVSACVPVHTFGHPCQIDEIVSVCNEYNLPVIEDAAESLGSMYKGKHTGTFGNVGVLSFNGNKIMTTGGGGMLLSDDEKTAHRAKHITTQAKVPHPWDFIHDETGYNFRMPNINAALGVAQLEELDRILKNKRETASLYMDFFAGTAFSFFSEPDSCRSNYWLNLFLLENRDQKEEFLRYSNQNGVMTRPAWTLMHKLTMFRQEFRQNLDNAELMEDTLVNIPSSYRTEKVVT
jgi:perosamine synthetase